MSFAKKLILSFSLCMFISPLCQPYVHGQAKLPSQKSWQRLISFEGQEFTKLQQETRDELEAHANRLVPNRKTVLNNERSFHRFLWHLWRVKDANGEVRYALLEGQGIITIPGNPILRLYLFDDAGNYLSTTDIHTGWRRSPQEVKIIETENIDGSTLMISSQDMRPLVRHYYAFTGTQVALIRLEDGKGKIVRNIYAFSSSPDIGPETPQRSAQQWETALAGGHPVEVLETLVWLGGIHADPEQIDDFIAHEKLEDARLFQSVRVMPNVRQTLEQLKHSNNAWIKEAARLALEPVSEDKDY